MSGNRTFMMRRIDEIARDFCTGRIRLDDAVAKMTLQEMVLFRDKFVADAALLVAHLPRHVDREAVLDFVELLARLIEDDGAQHALAAVVRLYRLPQGERRRRRALAVLNSMPPGEEEDDR